jgi:xylulokinase
MGKYLGMDLSTQSLSAVILDSETSEIIYEQSVSFGKDMPEYNSPEGFLLNDNPLVCHSNPLMWAKSFDLLFSKMKNDGVNMYELTCISGSGQQHGSVYMNNRSLNPSNWYSGNSLDEIISPMLSRKSSPIWMDSSTSLECEEIAKFAGGACVVREKSGSIPVERFSGPQIRKFFKRSPEAYDNTSVIHLVSSFAASILAGKNVPIDIADASGMNLLNIADASWDQLLLDATAPGLQSKLLQPVSSDFSAGRISPYFVRKYGFNPECRLNVWSGDNPNSLIGMGGFEKGTAVISLGTSDTFMASFESPVTDPEGFGHAFCNPDGGYMCLICFKNGSLAREKVKDEFTLSLKKFDEIVENYQSVNSENITIPFYVPEITPLLLEPAVLYTGDDDFVRRSSPEKGVRSIVDSQLINMKIHSAWIKTPLKKIRITGGASNSDGICQAAADIFQVEVERFQIANSAGIGAAFRALNFAEGIPLKEAMSSFMDAGGKSVFIPDTAQKMNSAKLEAAFRNSLASLMN